MAEGDTKTIYIVRKIDNGEAVIYAHCETPRVAERVKALNPGADIIPWQAVIHNGFWCAPYRELLQTQYDIDADAAEVEYNRVKAKALTLGLTLGEIQLLEDHDE